ncbi:MAG TPA: SulP family inorganic anion transporter [Limnobacter sp.]|nr:SulP family inorganic anion transporter [Limnobacter sp.]
MNIELKAGALVAFAGFAQAVVYGMLAFAPLGENGLHYGIYAGLASALLGSAAGALRGAAAAQFGGPRSSTSLIVAGSLLGFLQFTDDHLQLMLLLAVEIFLAGTLILLAQRHGIGKLMQFLPAPVLIGMNTTLGFFSAYKLLPAMAGFAIYTSFLEAFAEPSVFSWFALTVSTATVLLMVYFRAVKPNPLGLIYSLAIGLGLHILLGWAWPQGQPTQSLEFLPAPPLLANGVPGLLSALQTLPGLFLHQPELLVQVLAGALVLALLIVLESMQSLLQVDQALGTRHDTARELKVVGASNLLCGLFLALPSSNYFPRSTAALAVGSKTRQSETWYLVSLTLILMATWPFFEHLPIHILATVVAINSVFLIKGSTLKLFAQFLRRRPRVDMPATDRFTVVVVASMMIATGLSNLLVGTLVGVLFVAAYFLQQQSGSGLRSIEFNPVARSRSMRPRAQRQQLDQAFKHLAWVRFEGNLFFGNAPSIAIQLQDELGEANAIILDFTHVCYIDDTASACVERLMGSAPNNLKIVVVLPIAPDQCVDGEELIRHILERFKTPAAPNIDEAFWWIENQLLEQSAEQPGLKDAEDTLLQSHLCDDMDPVQFAQFSAYWEPAHLAVNQVLFKAGDAPCGLYILQQGQLSAWHEKGDNGERLMRFCPGSLVGELSLIDNKPRSATLQADTDCRLLFLPARHFDTLRQEQAELGRLMLNNLAREMALRIRLANQSLVQLQ